MTLEKHRNSIMNSLLSGKVFISTRPKGKSDELRSLFEKEGACVFELPMIELTDSNKHETIKTAIKNLKNYSHIVFTSANAFHFFYNALLKEKNHKEILNKLKIASIGYKTSDEIKSKALNIDFDGKAKTGKEFASKLYEYLKGKNASVVWLTGDLSPNHLIDTIQPIANISRLNIYSNSIPTKVNQDIIDRINDDNYDMIVLASPSAINNLITLIKNTKLKVVCIGQTTAEAALNHGITPLTIAKEPNAIGILNAVCKYYRNNNS